MTISSTVRIAGPYIGSGAATVFSFAFKVFAAVEMRVAKLNTTSNVEIILVLNTDYTVQLNGDQNGTPGGTITLPSVLASGYNLTITSDIANLQPTDLTNQGGFYPEVITDALDRATIQIQQLDQNSCAIKIPLSDGVLDMTTPVVSARQGKYLAFDSLGLPVVSAGTGNDSALRTDLANATAVSAGSRLSGFRQTGTGATARTVDAKLKDTVSVKDFGAVSNASTDNTAAVQLAINSIGIYGGVVYIEDGCYFYLKLLTFPNEFCDLSYRITDNRDTQVVTSRKGTNERVIFTVNSGYPANLGGGLVGEQIFSSPLHPGMVLNARPDINTATVLSKLGPGQDLNNPIRASYRIESENITKFQMEFQEYSTSGNLYSGMYFNGMYYSIVLSGVSSASWTTPPALYSIVTGSISGAKGFILSNTTNTTIHWFYGAFQVGDYLVSSAPTSPTTSTTAITAISVSTLVSFQPLTNSTQTGNWCIGLYPTNPTQNHLFAVGGKIAAAQSVSYGQLLTTVSNPAFVLIDNYHTSNNGFEITYNTTPIAARRRVTLRKLGVATDVAHIGAIFAHTSFTVAYGCSNSSYNITKLTGGFSQIAVGHYRLTFINAAAYADYCVSVAVSDPMQYAYVYSIQTTYVDIKVVTIGTTTPVALSGSCHVSCMGGDVSL